MGDEMYFASTTENVGLGPAFGTSIEIQHPKWNIGLEHIPALAPGGKKSRSLPLGTGDMAAISTGDDRFWLEIQAAVRYSDVQNESRYEADLHAAPQADEWMGVVGFDEEYLSKFPFDLIGVRRLRGSE